jgi:hypothetical protein
MAKKVFDFEWPQNMEPLRTDRWILKIGRVPSYLVRNLNIESFVEDDKTYTKLSFSLMNVVNYTIVPDDIITLKKINLDFLNPVGEVVNAYDMRVEFDKMSFKCDYADGGILTHNFVFYVKNLNQLYSNVGEESEKEIVENYKKNKKKEKEGI